MGFDKDMSSLRGGYFLATGMWLFGVTLIIALMAYHATKD